MTDALLCCFLECDAEATWEIDLTIGRPDTYTHSCDEHLAVMADTFGEIHLRLESLAGRREDDYTPFIPWVHPSQVKVKGEEEEGRNASTLPTPPRSLPPDLPLLGEGGDQ